MELWVFIGAVFVVVVIGLWRSRARGGGDNGPNQGLPDDLRDKHFGITGSQGGNIGGHRGGPGRDGDARS
jgi:hypothetical protein